MVILVTTSPRARECAAAIEQTTHQKTQIATSLARAVECLQSHEYDALVIDESFNHAEIGGVNLLLNHAGLAMPIYVNLALHGTDRVTREVQNGILRFVREKLAAMRSAEMVLRNLLRGEVTAILLNSELALREPSLSESVAEKIQVMHDLADRMRLKLEGAPADEFGGHTHLPTAVSRELRARTH
jgi:DNA-binding NtrC family response regulator